MPDPLNEALDLDIDTDVDIDGVLGDAVGAQPLPPLRIAPRKRDAMGIRENRESDFERDLGRFRDPGTGRIERGSPPPDLDTDVNRYRAEDGRFKRASSDLFDEEAEVKRDSLKPRG